MGKKIFSILLYIKRITDHIGKILNKYLKKPFSSSQKKIGQILKNLKDQRPQSFSIQFINLLALSKRIPMEVLKALIKYLYLYPC